MAVNFTPNLTNGLKQFSNFFARLLGLQQNAFLFPHLRCCSSTTNLATTCKAGRQRFREIKPRPHKLRLANEVRHLFHDNEMVAVMSYYDMKTVEWNNFIHEAGNYNIKLRFLPNKIVHRALDSTAYVNICPLFISTTAVAYSKDVQIKGLIDTLKSQKKVQLLGGKINDRLYGVKKLMWVSRLPSLEQLHCELSMTLSLPSQNITQALIQNQQVLSQNLELLASPQDS